MSYQHCKTERGFTLIELMIVTVIIAIIVSVALPSYRQYVQRANRTDATTALLRLAAAQERFYLQNGTYAGNDLLDDAPPAGLGFSGTDRGWYSVEITSDNLATGYTITATADGPPQNNDEDCESFTISETGARGSSPSEMATCWR